MNSTPQLGYRIVDRGAALRLITAAHRLGCRALPISDRKPDLAPGGLDMAALVLDLEPWDGQALRNLEMTRKTVPRLPILVYYPDHDLATDAAAQASQFPRVTAKMQMADSGEIERLRRWLKPGVATWKSEGFDAIVEALIPASPDGLARRFSKLVVKRMREGWKSRPRVGDLASELGCSRRHLERSCVSAGLPAPHDLVDHLIVNWLDWTAGKRQLSELHASALLGFTPRDVRRIRARAHQRLAGIGLRPPAAPKMALTSRSTPSAAEVITDGRQSAKQSEAVS